MEKYRDMTKDVEIHNEVIKEIFEGVDVGQLGNEKHKSNINEQIDSLSKLNPQI